MVGLIASLNPSRRRNLGRDGQAVGCLLRQAHNLKVIGSNPIGDLFAPFPRLAASQQTHEFDEAWIGRMGALWCKRQLRLPGPGDILAFLSNGLLHRNATYCRLNGDDPEQHQHCD